MAQNVTIAGASYSDVPSIEVPKTGGGTAAFFDTTISSNAASASDIASGKMAWVNGTLVTGTGSGGSSNDFIITFTYDSTEDAYIPNCTYAEWLAAFNAGKTISGIAVRAGRDPLHMYYGYSDYDSEDGFYFAVGERTYDTIDNVGNWKTHWFEYLFDSSNTVSYSFDWYDYECNDATASPADVISGRIFYTSLGRQVGTGSGGSSYTLLHSEEITVSTTSTTVASVKTIRLSSGWTYEDIIYVRIRDKAGPRTGYFYGSDNFLINRNAKNGGSSTNNQNIMKYSWNYDGSSYLVSMSTSTSPYGVCVSQADKNGASGISLTIVRRYNSSNSKTINGTFLVEVYTIKHPLNRPFFE